MGINLDNGTFIAVKDIRFKKDTDTSWLVGSFEIYKRLNHPNLCRYYGVEVHPDHVYILSETYILVNDTILSLNFMQRFSGILPRKP
jgi:serine/threonine protein kinase